MQNLNYAGIGARKITPAQQQLITTVATYLAGKHYRVHSGAAEGTDQQFSTSALEASGTTTLHIPWTKHSKEYREAIPAQYRDQVETRILQSKMDGQDSTALASVDQYHPAPDRLSWGARLLHARNYRILVPSDPVAFVVALPSIHDGKPVGGTMQGIRIAKKIGIPVVRLDGAAEENVLDQLARLTSSIWG